MSAPEEYVVPGVLRAARFVPRQAPGRREPLRVTADAFRTRDLEVPEDRALHNAYQLSGRQGWPWSPRIDYHIRRRGAEMLGGSDYLCIDLDQHLAVDGSVWLDGLRWLADAGTATGELLDITMFVAVRTPGNPGRRHGPGWHLWCRADPEYRVRSGPLARCTAVEIKVRCTAPGSPGYEVRSAPGELPVIPRWVALLAGQPRPVSLVPPGTRGRPGRAWHRLRGAISDLYLPGALRNNALFKAACRARELIDAGGLDQARAEALLLDAANQVGLVRDDGAARCLATIRSGLTVSARQAGRAPRAKGGAA
jgi:hypothetical protein